MVIFACVVALFCVTYCSDNTKDGQPKKKKLSKKKRETKVWSFCSVVDALFFRHLLLRWVAKRKRSKSEGIRDTKSAFNRQYIGIEYIKRVHPWNIWNKNKSQQFTCYGLFCVLYNIAVVFQTEKRLVWAPDQQIWKCRKSRQGSKWQNGLYLW